MRRECLIFCLLLTSGSVHSQVVSYKGPIRLPVDLYTAEGTRLEKGQYDLEVTLEKAHYKLLFLQKGQTKGFVKGEVFPDSNDPPTGIPLVGTQYLRSTANPIGTEAERRFSKTRVAQYQEENRDWAAAMRVYKNPDEKKALLLFVERGAEGVEWKRIEFTLFLGLNPPR